VSFREKTDEGEKGGGPGFVPKRRRNMREKGSSFLVDERKKKKKTAPSPCWTEGRIALSQKKRSPCHLRNGERKWGKKSSANGFMLSPASPRSSAGKRRSFSPLCQKKKEERRSRGDGRASAQREKKHLPFRKGGEKEVYPFERKGKAKEGEEGKDERPQVEKRGKEKGREKKRTDTIQKRTEKKKKKVAASANAGKKEKGNLSYLGEEAPCV